MARTDQLRIFCSYAHEDEDLRNELFGHLELLHRSGIIKTWYDGGIAAGQDWHNEIEKHLRLAHVILLLVSVDLLRSEFVQSVELPLALRMHSQRAALVIPVLVRPIAWDLSGLSMLQALPEGLRPVVQWSPRDLAWVSVCEGLVKAILVWGGSESGTNVAEPRSSFVGQAPRRRVLDLGLPQRVPVGLSTVLAVMIRRPQSAGLAGLLDLEASYGVRPEEVKSSQQFPVDFPRNRDGSLAPAECSVVLETSDFSCAAKSKTLCVPPRGDSDVCVFLLTPLRTGRLFVNVDLIYRDKRVASRLLSSSGVAGVGFEPAVESVELNLVPEEPEPQPERAVEEPSVNMEDTGSFLPPEPEPQPEWAQEKLKEAMISPGSDFQWGPWSGRPMTSGDAEAAAPPPAKRKSSGGFKALGSLIAVLLIVTGTSLWHLMQSYPEPSGVKGYAYLRDEQIADAGAIFQSLVLSGRTDPKVVLWWLALDRRADALRDRLKWLTQEPGTSGESLGRYIQIAEWLIDTYLHDAAAAIKAGHADIAMQLLQAAEKEIDCLEMRLDIRDALRY